KTYSHLSMGTPVARVERTNNTTTSLEFQFHGLANNTLAAVAQGGTINASFTYAPFGERLESTDGGAPQSAGLAAHKRRSNDKYEDDLSALAYYGARYYDKTLIGWTQSDPLFRFEPDAAWISPRKANLYVFTLQNSLRYLDPDGRAPRTEREWLHAQDAQTPRDEVVRTTDGGAVLRGPSSPTSRGNVEPVNFIPGLAGKVSQFLLHPDPPSPVDKPGGPRGGTSSSGPDARLGNLADRAALPNTRINLLPKSDASPARTKNDKMKESSTLNDALDQESGIRGAQQASRGPKSYDDGTPARGGAKIESIEKSKQNTQTRLNNIKSKDDVDDID
ncbi:MAG: RHS repeat-associated core domain-containing protein, partial [Kofleriaceae bacterium]